VEAAQAKCTLFQMKHRAPLRMSSFNANNALRNQKRILPCVRHSNWYGCAPQTHTASILNVENKCRPFYSVHHKRSFPTLQSKIPPIIFLAMFFLNKRRCIKIKHDIMLVIRFGKLRGHPPPLIQPKYLCASLASLCCEIKRFEHDFVSNYTSWISAPKHWLRKSP